MRLVKEDLQNYYNRFDYEIYIMNLDFSKEIKDNILKVDSVLHDLISAEEMFGLVEKIVKGG